jgi:serine/threonine protein kinase/Flp pilus assembly protein TadD
VIPVAVEKPSLDTIVCAAIDIASAEERASFLAQACGDDRELLERAERLVKAHLGAGSFLESHAAASALSPKGARAEVRGTPTMDQPVTEATGMVIGPYKLVEQIGEGGMGAVWMAQQMEPVKRLVALKLIKAGMDSKQIITRFEAERQALALMDHPNIAKVLGAGATDAGRPYFVMDLVKGAPITKYCDEHHLTPRQRLELFIPVCQAVQHAHQKGIIHRDLKPSNVLVALYDGQPVPKVIDFGVAKAAGQPLTEQTLVTGFGAIVGTLEYMSPEQAEINQLDIDTRSDIYSLGVLLYELLTGSPPFTRKELEKAGMLEMLRVIREQEPSKPSTKLSTAEGLPTLAANRGTEPAKLTKLVRGELDWIVMKALEKDRNHRYETANGFAMDVQRYLADEAVQACPPSVTYRLRKFLRRNKGPALAASLVLLALLAGIVGTTWQAVRAERRAEGERLTKERAETNFNLANEAVEKYLVTVTYDPDLKRADFYKLRKKLLESAIPFFQKIATQRSDDPEVEAGRGRAYLWLAHVRVALGENEAAIRDWEEMRTIFARLTAEFPTVPEYRYKLAASHSNLANSLKRLGQHVEAEAAFRQAMGMKQKLIADFPTEPVYRQELAETHSDLGMLLQALGRREEAEAAYVQALDIRTKLEPNVAAVPESRLKLAQSHGNLGELLAELGKLEQAETAYRQSLDILEKLVAEHPTEWEYRQSLAYDLLRLGSLHEEQEALDKAEVAWRRALSIREKLAAEFPTLPHFRQQLADSHAILGILRARQQQHPESEAAFREALRISRKLADDFPTVPEYRHGLAARQDCLGNALSNQGKRKEAEAAYLLALDIKEKLVADFPNVQEYALGLGGAYCNFGILMYESGQPEAALGWYQKAIVRLEALLAVEPRLVTAREFLGNSHAMRANTLAALGRHEEAVRDWQRALELAVGSKKAAFRRMMFRTKKDAASYLAAAAEYEVLKPTGAGAMYKAACCRAVCAAVIREDPKTPEADAPRLAKDQADLAMAWLHKAVAAGYKDVEHMKQDTDLDALREREDFKKLLIELEAKKRESGVRNQEPEKKPQ